MNNDKHSNYPGIMMNTLDASGSIILAYSLYRRRILQAICSEYWDIVMHCIAWLVFVLSPNHTRTARFDQGECVCVSTNMYTYIHNIRNNVHRMRSPRWFDRWDLKMVKRGAIFGREDLNLYHSFYNQLRKN